MRHLLVTFKLCEKRGKEKFLLEKDVLCIDLELKWNCGFRTNEYYRVSTAVTIISDSASSSSDVALEVSIRFHELPLASNDTQFGTLFCSSVQIPDSPESPHKWNISQSWWKPNDTSCQKFAHAQGIECRCDKPGTYALLKIMPIMPQVGTFEKFKNMSRKCLIFTKIVSYIYLQTLKKEILREFW